MHESLGPPFPRLPLSLRGDNAISYPTSILGNSWTEEQLAWKHAANIFSQTLTNIGTQSRAKRRLREQEGRMERVATLWHVDTVPKASKPHYLKILRSRVCQLSRKTRSGLSLKFPRARLWRRGGDLDVFRAKVVFLRAAESTNFRRLRLRLRPENSTPAPAPIPLRLRPNKSYSIL